MDNATQEDINALLDSLAQVVPSSEQFIPDNEMPETDKIISVLVASDMNMRLASERLGKIPVAQLVSHIVSDPSAPVILAQQLRTYSMLGMAVSFARTQEQYIDVLPNMSAYDVSKSYTALLQQVMASTDPNGGTNVNFNMTEVVMRMMPPEAREAMKQLAAEPLTIEAEARYVTPSGEGHG